MKGTAWKHFKDAKNHYYIMQINGIKGKREENKVRKYMTGETLKFFGEGFDPKSKESVLLFEKPFESNEEWLEYARELPFSLVELNNKGNKKAYKLGADYRPKNK